MANPSIDFERERINLINSNRRSLDSIIDLKQSRDAVAGNYAKMERDKVAIRSKVDSWSKEEYERRVNEILDFLARKEDEINATSMTDEEKQAAKQKLYDDYNPELEDLMEIQEFAGKSEREKEADIENALEEVKDTIEREKKDFTKKIKDKVVKRVRYYNMLLTVRGYSAEQIFDAYSDFANNDFGDPAFNEEFYIMINEALEKCPILKNIVASLSDNKELNNLMEEAKSLVENGISNDDVESLIKAERILAGSPPSQDKEDLYRAIGKKLEQLLEKYKAEKNLDGLESLIPAIKGLPDGSDRKRDLLEDIESAIDAVKKAIEEDIIDDSKDDDKDKDDDITPEQIAEIEALLQKAARENDVDALKDAIAKIDDLPDCDKKQELTDRMNVIRKHIIDYYLEQTKESKDMWDLSQAKKAVNTMSEGPDKEDYKRKIAELEEMIKTWKPKLSWKTGLAIAAGGLVGGLAGHFLPGIGKIAVVAAGSIGTAIAKKNRNKAKAERLSGTKKVVNVKEPKTKLGEKLIQLKNYLSQEEQLRDIQYGLTAMAAAAGIAGAIQTIRQLVGGNAAAVSGPGTTEQDPGITPTDDSIPDVLPTETVIPDVEMPDLNNIDLTGISQGYIDSEGNGLTSLITEAGKHAKFDRVVNGMAHFKQANGKGFAWIPVESLPEKVQEAIQATIEMGGRSL